MLKSLCEIYNEILSENVSLGSIINAIENKLAVSFEYLADGKASGTREGEIYVLGDSKSGAKIIRVFQTRGATSSQNNKWKTFKVADVTNLKIKSKIANPRPDFNRNDDLSMIKIDKIMQF